jgi:hypothetical protein
MKEKRSQTAKTAGEALKKRVNRTGMAMSPKDAKVLVEGAEKVVPSAGSLAYVMRYRTEWAGEADPVGSTPPPASVKGAVKTVLEMAKGQDPNTLLDKLGERLAYERTGTRLYDQVLAKLEAYGDYPGGPTRGELARYREEERAHAVMLREAIESFGGDPTVMTPGADLAGVEAQGLVQAASDPRVTLGMSLHAILLAELGDADGWELLISLVRAAGHEPMAQRFEAALEEEAIHLRSVRAWVTAYATSAASLTGREAEQEAAE